MEIYMNREIARGVLDGKIVSYGNKNNIFLDSLVEQYREDLERFFEEIITENKTMNLEEFVLAAIKHSSERFNHPGVEERFFYDIKES